MKKLLLSFVLFIVQLPIAGQEIPKLIHSEVTGKGQPISFIPAITVPGNMWSFTLQKLQSGYECHVFTLAGFDEKAPIDFPWLPKINTAIEEYSLYKMYCLCI